MKITLRRINLFSPDYPKISRLYRTAFPADERAPMTVLTYKSGRDNVDFWGLYANDEWIGLAYAISENDLTYLFYLALAEDVRGKGLGSRALQALLRYYEGSRFYIALEQLDPSAENIEERKRRRQFYLKNGLKPIKRTIREASVVYDVMSTGNVEPEEYNTMMRNYLGKRVGRLVSMDVVE
ncbi:MAG: GNAT family N-acetyltransferase [Oscillospiraceae bacterium]|nr:GNAT family N-acetyltransferase [Oscillospiraceae bacterium]